MKVINAQTNVETIVVGGVSADLQPGVEWTLVGPATVRGSTYSDDGTNDYQVIIGPASVNVYTTPSEQQYLEQSFEVGAVIGIALLGLIVITKGLRAGIETG